MKKIVWMLLVLGVAACSRQIFSEVSYEQKGLDCIKTEKSTILERGRLTKDVETKTIVFKHVECP